MEREPRMRGAGARPSIRSRRIGAFLEMLAAERGAARNTIEAYGRDLADYESCLARTGRSPDRAEAEDIRAYLGRMSRAGLRRARSSGDSRPCASSTASSPPKGFALTTRPSLSTARARAGLCRRSWAKRR